MSNMNLHHGMIKAAESIVTIALAILMMFTSFTISNANAGVEGENNSVGIVGITNTDDRGYLISAELALNTIKEADRAGADTVPLIHRYNEALELLHDAQNPESTLCATYEECKSQVDSMFVSISADAVGLKDETNRMQSEQIVLSEISVVAGAILASFLGLCSHRAWKNYQIRQFLAMEIREVEDRLH